MATYTDNYQLTKPTYAEQADIGVINSNMNIIDDIMHSSQISLAPAYDSTQTYAEGDVVMYELLMYKCIAPTTGVWDGSKWERTTASESGGGGSAELDILGEASGAVASFADGASAGLAKCIADIEATQSGSGTPSPSNPRPISGRSSITITVSDGTNDTTYTTALGQTVYGGTLNVLTGELVVTHKCVVFNGAENWQIMTGAGVPHAFRIDGSWGAKSVRVGTANGYSNKYEYSLISLPDQGYRFADNNSNTLYIYDQTYNNDLAGFKASLVNINMQMLFELATPQTVQLTPQEVNSLLGENNISADTGDIDIVYVKASAPIQPNPTGEPTATLSKLGIEGTVFEIPSGGGGSSGGIVIDGSERVIGTYFGKPLYQKVINPTISTSTSIAGDLRYGTFSLGDYISSVDKAFLDLSASYIEPVVGETRGIVMGYYESDSGNMLIMTMFSRTNCPSSLCIKYTKITD